MPLKNVTLLSGESGVGKSIVSLHLAMATVLGRDWLSALPTPGPALVVCCEDDTDELHRRLDRMLEHYRVTVGSTYEDLKELHLLSFAGQDAVLAAPDRHGLVQATKLFEPSTKPPATSAQGLSSSITAPTCLPVKRTSVRRYGNS